MFLFEVILNALVLGGMYALVALGLNLQYGVARMMNLSYGEFFMVGAFAAFWTVMLWKLDPLLALIVSVPVSFVANWLIYRLLLLRLIRRSPDQDALDADVILVTFGLLFVFQGLAIVNWGGEYRGYTYLAVPVKILGAEVALNRLLAFLAACVLAAVLFVILGLTRTGAALRAMAIDPVAAGWSASTC